MSLSTLVGRSQVDRIILDSTEKPSHARHSFFVLKVKKSWTVNLKWGQMTTAV